MPALADFHEHCDGADWSPAFAAALASINPGWGGSIGWPDGLIDFSQPVILPRSGIHLAGGGPKCSAIRTASATDPAVIIGGNGLIAEACSVKGIDVIHTATRAPGAVSVVIDRAARTVLEDMEIGTANIAVGFGTQLQPNGVTIARLNRVRSNFTLYGVMAWGGAALFEAACQWNFVGTPLTGGAGLRVVGPMDGILIDGTTTFEECDFGIQASPFSGSLANLKLVSACFDRPRMAAVRLETNSSSVINGVRASEDVDIWADGGNADGFLIYATNPGSIQDVRISANARNLRGRFASMSGVSLNARFVAPASIDGLAGYPMIDAGGGSHQGFQVIHPCQTGHGATLVGHQNAVSPKIVL
jgi:hypothetical protein